MLSRGLLYRVERSRLLRELRALRAEGCYVELGTFQQQLVELRCGR